MLLLTALLVSIASIVAMPPPPDASALMDRESTYAPEEMLRFTSSDLVHNSYLSAIAAKELQKEEEEEKKKEFKKELTIERLNREIDDLESTILASCYPRCRFPNPRRPQTQTRALPRVHSHPRLPLPQMQRVRHAPMGPIFH